MNGFYRRGLKTLPATTPSALKVSLAQVSIIQFSRTIVNHQIALINDNVIRFRWKSMGITINRKKILKSQISFYQYLKFKTYI